MLKPKSWERWLFYASSRGKYICIVLAAMFVGLTRTPASAPESYLAISAWLKPHEWWVMPLLSGGALLLAWTAKHIGEPWLWEAVHEILQEYRDRTFNNDDPVHHHRVTLFRHVPQGRLHVLLPISFAKATLKLFSPRFARTVHRIWLSYGSFVPALVAPGRLIPVCRSGHTTQNTRTVWRAREDGWAEGVVGQCWSACKSKQVEKLPDLNAGTSEETDVVSYAERTSSSVEWVKSRLKGQDAALARSFLAIPVQIAQKPWGVVVIDSRAEEIPSKPSAMKDYQRLADFLKVLLRRAQA